MRTLKAIVLLPVVILSIGLTYVFGGFLRDDVTDLWRELRTGR